MNPTPDNLDEYRILVNECEHLLMVTYINMKVARITKIQEEAEIGYTYIIIRAQ